MSIFPCQSVGFLRWKLLYVTHSSSPDILKELLARIIHLSLELVSKNGNYLWVTLIYLTFLRFTKLVFCLVFLFDKRINWTLKWLFFWKILDEFLVSWFTVLTSELPFWTFFFEFSPSEVKDPAQLFYLVVIVIFWLVFLVLIKFKSNLHLSYNKNGNQSFNLSAISKRQMRSITQPVIDMAHG